MSDRVGVPKDDMLMVDCALKCAASNGTCGTQQLESWERLKRFINIGERTFHAVLESRPGVTFQQIVDENMLKGVSDE